MGCCWGSTGHREDSTSSEEAADNLLGSSGRGAHGVCIYDLPGGATITAEGSASVANRSQAATFSEGYRLQEKIGKGSSSECYRCVDRRFVAFVAPAYAGVARNGGGVVLRTALAGPPQLKF